MYGTTENKELPSLQQMLNYNRKKLDFSDVEIQFIEAEKLFNSLEEELKQLLITKNYSLLNNTSKKQNGNKTIVFYSGGLESTIETVSVINCDIVYVKHLNEFCHSKGINIVESFLMATASLLNANTIVLGLEYSPNNPDIFEYSTKFIEQFTKYLNIQVILPIIYIDKFSLFKQAIKRNLIFNSCKNVDDLCENTIPCGNCFKCFQISTFQRAIGILDPIKINKNLINAMIKEHNNYLVSGIDLYEDNYSFTCIDKSLEEIWKV